MFRFGSSQSIKQGPSNSSFFQSLFSRVHPVSESPRIESRGTSKEEPSMEEETPQNTRTKIILFIGSNREGRQGEKVADYVRKALEKAGMSVIVFDPATMNFESIHQPLLFMKDQSTAPTWLLEANDDIKSADGFVIVHSEYNCGVPPALSHMMNCFPPSSFRHRPCSIVTYSMGDFGGVRAATIVQPFVSELGMIALPSRVTLPSVHTKFTSNGGPNNKRFTLSVDRMIKELSWYAEALKKAREISVIP